MSNPTNRCLAPACKWRPPGECVYYSGPNINTYNITTGDNLNTVIQKITTHIQQGTETANSVEDTWSVNMHATGTLNRIISADVRRDPATDNRLIINSDGLYVGPVTSSVDYNNETGDLTVVVDGDSHVIPINPEIDIEVPVYTADNGLTMTGTNTQLGGLLLHSSIIDHTGGDYQLE